MSFGLDVYTNNGRRRLTTSIEARTAPKMLFTKEMLNTKYHESGVYYLDLGVSWERADFVFVNHRNHTFYGHYDRHTARGSAPKIFVRKVPEQSQDNILAVELVLWGAVSEGEASSSDTVDLFLVVLGY